MKTRHRDRTKNLFLAALAIVAAALAVSPRQARSDTDRLFTKAPVSAMVLAATSKAIHMDGFSFYSFTHRCESITDAGTAEYKVEWYSSNLDDQNTMTEVISSDIYTATANDSTWVTSVFHPPYTGFGWVVITGSGSNPSDTQCDGYLGKE